MKGRGFDPGLFIFRLICNQSIFCAKIEAMKAKHHISGLSLIEMLAVVFLLSTCLLPIIRHLVSTGSEIRDNLLVDTAATINTSYLETYRSQPYQRLKLLIGTHDLTVPADFRNRLQTTLNIREVIPDRLISLTISTALQGSENSTQKLAAMVANHHPVTGALQ